jgi:hypothetical protein
MPGTRVQRRLHLRQAGDLSALSGEPGFSNAVFRGEVMSGSLLFTMLPIVADVGHSRERAWHTAWSIFRGKRYTKPRPLPVVTLCQGKLLSGILPRLPSAVDDPNGTPIRPRVP